MCYIYGQQSLNNFIISQQKQLLEQQATLSFQDIQKESWSIFPKLVINLPKLEWQDQHSKNKFLWQGKTLSIGYTLLHPFSLTIINHNEQAICKIQNTLTNCYQVHGEPIYFYIPIQPNYTQGQIKFLFKNIFYQPMNPSQSWIKYVQLQSGSGEINWNLDKHSAFARIELPQIQLASSQFPPQSVHNINTDLALYQTNSADNHYKLLIQKFTAQWKDLAIHISGNINLSDHNMTTGDLSLYLENIHKAVIKEISEMTCCQEFKNYLLTISLPYQITLPLLIRDQEIYIGNIPLKTIYNQQLVPLKNILDQFQTKQNRRVH